MKTSRLREAFSVGVLIALLGTAVWYGVRPTSAPVAFAGPTVEDLDTLSRYLQPVPPAPEVESYDMFIPASESVPPRRSSPVAEPPRPRRLSAILVIGSEPIAIVDDQQVRAGSVLAGGAQVVSIDRSGVTLREADGRQRTLRLSDSAPGGSE